jgi:hypothetical protein
MHKLTTAQVKEAMENGDFGKEITERYPKVIIILTESWCPQWKTMHSYIEHMHTENVFYYIYDQEELFKEFMAFKEQVFQNDQIPYLRFYENGRFTGASNYIPQEEFKKKLK